MADRFVKKSGAVLLALALALGFTFAIVHPAKAASATYNANLVINGDAEFGLNGWAVDLGSHFSALSPQSILDLGLSPLSPSGGNAFDCYTGGAATESLYQIIDISNLAADIQTGLVNVQLSAYARKFMVSSGHTIKLELLDESENVLGEFTHSGIPSPNYNYSWQPLMIGQNGINPNTKKLRVTLAATVSNDAPGMNYVEFDGVSLILTEDIPPVLTAEGASRTDASSATVSFTSSEPGAYYYSVVEDGSPEPAVATGGAGTALEDGVNTVSLTGLASSGARDIYIKAKGADNDMSGVLKIDIPAYVAPGASLFDFGTGEDNPSGAKSLSYEDPVSHETVTLTASEDGILYFSRGERGNPASALGDISLVGMSGRVVATNMEYVRSVRISVGGKAFDLVSLNYADCSDISGNIIILSTSIDSMSFEANTYDAGGAVLASNFVDVSSDISFKGVTYVDVTSSSLGEILPVLDNIVVANVADADTTPPELSLFMLNRRSDTATVGFTSSEAGTYYYEVVADGADEPAIDTNGDGTACTEDINTFDLTALTAQACDIYIKVKDAAGNVSDALKIDIPAYAAPDTTPPALTAGTAVRSSDTAATVTFTSGEAGTCYLEVAAAGAAEPDVDTTGPGTACAAGMNTIDLTALTAGEKDIYIKVKDAAGNVSDALKMDIPAYAAPDTTPPVLTAGASNRLTAATATVIFISDEAGAYYYKVVADGAAEPDVDTSGAGSPLAAGGNAIQLTGIDPGALDIYIKAKDAAGNVSGALMVDIAELFIPVTGISGVPAAAWAGTDRTLTGTVSPEDATNQAIVWTVKDAGATFADISGDILSTSAAGTAVIRATIVHGASIATDYTQDFAITVNPPMSHQTLQDQAETGTISVEGIFGQGAQLTVVPIAAGDSDREEMEQQLTGKETVAAYEVFIEPAEAFQPPLLLTFQVNERYNGRKVYILHKLSDGSMESFTPTVTDGKAVITVYELSPFLLAVDQMVVITEQPRDAIALVGQTAAFHVAADGQAPLTYRWQRRTSVSAAWNDISGAAGPEYTTSVVNKSHNGYQYRVIVSDGLGNSVTSDIATLTVTVPPDTGDHSQPLAYAALVILFAGLLVFMHFRRRTA